MKDVWTDIDIDNVAVSLYDVALMRVCACVYIHWRLYFCVCRYVSIMCPVLSAEEFDQLQEVIVSFIESTKWWVRAQLSETFPPVAQGGPINLFTHSLVNRQ